MNINVMITKYNIKINMVTVKKYFLLRKQFTFGNCLLIMNLT